MHVFAVGRCMAFSSFDMHILGFKDPNPKVGGREQDVTYNSN